MKYFNLLQVNKILVDYFYVIDKNKIKTLNNKIYYYESYLPLEKNNLNIAIQLSKRKRIKIILNENPKSIYCIKVLLHNKIYFVDEMFFSKL